MVDFWECVYFSVIAQTTIGFGDIVPVREGRIFAASQGLVGTLYLAIFIGLYLLKYIWTTDVVRVSKVMAFDPDDRVFRVRILNPGSFDLHNISLELWEHYRKLEFDFLSNREIPLHYQHIVTLRSMSTWLIKTKPIDSERVGSIFAHVRWFDFQVDGKYTYTNYVETFQIKGTQIWCGKFERIKKVEQPRSDYKNYQWSKFDVVAPQAKSIETCKQCPFWGSCTCVRTRQRTNLLDDRMNYEDSLEYLDSLGFETIAMEFGLEKTRKMLEILGNPHRKYVKVQVLGTNGKGSVTTMVGNICRSAGTRTGVYISPHLHSITERIRLDGAAISKTVFAMFATEVRAASEKLLSIGAISKLPTFFEQVTVIALLAFASNGIELAALETGLGGRFDSVTATDAEVLSVYAD